MNARAELRKGWCPGALRPMETGDGLLVRVRPRAGLFSILALRTIADVAARYGSGEIDLTNRANLQIRGLSEHSWRDAIAKLDAACLIDDDAGVESVRNVVVDPLFGLDPERADLRPLAAELECRLIEDRELHLLPNKFGFSVGDAKSDIGISAASPEHSALHLDGDDNCVASVQIADAVESAIRLAKVFLAMMLLGPRRMRDAVAMFGAAEMFAHAGLRAVSQKSDQLHASLVGVLQQSNAPFAVGIGLPFGRINAAQLSSLCAVANEGDARPSPSRVLVFPVKASCQAARLLDAAAGLDLIINLNDPRLTMDVCPGAPACRNATTSTRVDALRIAELLQGLDERASIHISGCVKGCARRGAAHLTILASAGRYDIIRDGDVEASPVFSSIAPADLSEAARSALAGRRP